VNKKNQYNKLSKEILETIRNKFVQGIDDGTGERKYQTLDSLAVEYNVAKSSLYRHGQKENWKTQQERFHTEYLEKLDAERQKELVKESKVFDSNALRVAKFLLNEVGVFLSQNTQIRIQDPNDKRILNPLSLSQLATASISAQKLGKLALGESTENMKLNAEISDTDAFREAMELLDTVAEQRRQADDSPVH
jgi:sulfur relay (sulfurtransferase) DsrF/TusC family protein